MTDIDYLRIISDRIALIRTQRGVSAREMSFALGQSPSYINKIENKKTLPSLEAFFAICEYLQVDPKDLLSDEIKYPIRVNIAIQELNQLNREQLDRMISIMQDINKYR